MNIDRVWRRGFYILQRTLRKVPVSVVWLTPCELLPPIPRAIIRTAPGYTATRVQLIRLP